MGREVEVKVKSLYKSLKILDCFTSKNPEFGITELAEKLNLNKSNVHNILATLVAAGYVEKNAATDKYKLSLKMLEFSYVITSRLEYQAIIFQIMQRLSEDLNSMIYFGVLHKTYVLYLYNTYPKGNNNYLFRSLMGEKAPLYCTAIGKAMLSTMDHESILKHIDMERLAYTPHTLIADAAIIADVTKSAERGYAIDNIEHESNIRCIGVPILSRDGKLIGGLSTSGSAWNFTESVIEKNAKILMNAAFEVRERL
jgi:IclR family KDG regulon transcriptional repressor